MRGVCLAVLEAELEAKKKEVRMAKERILAIHSRERKFFSPCWDYEAFECGNCTPEETARFPDVSIDEGILVKYRGETVFIPPQKAEDYLK